ncbi:MAG: T9SS type A sorting domain-containing protein [Bacteroidia bacterium]
MRQFITSFLLLICFAGSIVFGQQGAEIYGLNFTNSQLELASLNPATGATNVISPNPISPDRFGSGVSDIDPVSGRYFYVRDNRLYTVNLNTGQAITSPRLSNSTNAIAPLTNIAFNWLNDTIYGLQFTLGALRLAAADISTGQVRVISTNPISADIFSQGDADIDPIGRRYFYLRDGNQLITVDLNTGLAASKVRVNIPASFGPSAFMNITYNYMDGQIYGLIFKFGTGLTPCQGELFLAKADPATGALTVLSNTAVSNDCFSAGVCDIDPTTNRYFYPRQRANGQEIITVNTVTGTRISARPVNRVNSQPVYITNIAFNELYNVAPNSVIPMQMGDQGIIEMKGSSMNLNAWVGPDAQYRWQDGSTKPSLSVTEPGSYEVEITREGFTVKGKVEVRKTTGLAQNLALNTFTISPNPVQNRLAITIQEQQVLSNPMLSIVDIQGKILRSQKVKASNEIVNVDALPAGIYLLRLSANEGILTKRFVKK